MTKVCICQICTCGRHRCPHHPTSVINKGSQPCLLTEYANRYKPHPIDMRKPFKPEVQPMGNSGPVSDKTTNRIDYTKHPLSKPFVHQPDPYTTPEGDFDHMTSYTKEYIKRPFEKTQTSRKEYVKKSPGKFDGEPTYKSDYRKWAINRAQPVQHDAGYRPSSQPFEGQPTYTRDYPGKYGVPPRQSMRPQETARGSDAKFVGDTGYRQDYIKHPLPPKTPKEKAKYEGSKAPLDGLSNYRQDYIAKPFEANPSCRPDVGAYKSNAPFADDTTQKVDYKKWPAEHPYVHEPDQYKQPEGDFDFKTTTNLEYTKKPIDKVKSRAPVAAQRSPGKFDGNTNYSQDYRKWSLGDRPQIKQQAGYAPPDVPFEGTSNYTTDYIGHAQAPRSMMRPDETNRPSSQPFDGTTGYKQEYIKHAIPEKFQREKPQWNRNTVPLDGLSSYMKEFVPKDMHKNPSCKPDNSGYRSDAPFKGDTTQRIDFKQWPMERPHVHEPDQYTRPEGDFDHNTTTNLDYTKKPLETRRPMRPANRQSMPGKFEGTTNYTEDFRKWGLGDRAKPTNRGDGYVAPEVPFEGTTNYHDDYITRRAPPRASMKPTDGGYSSNAPFAGDTMYRTEFVKKNLPPCPAHVIEVGGKHGFVFKEQDSSGHKWYDQRPLSSSVKAVPTPPRVHSAQMTRPLAMSVA